MGVRGLLGYISENCPCENDHQLKNCKVIIDGKNLAHYLHRGCTGINIAFGGDFDKYANYVRKYFEAYQTCGVSVLVVMDGGQPLDGKKLSTAQERASSQILRSVAVDPEHHYKVFPPIYLEVFVSTLHKLGILVLQADYEADDEISSLARELNCTVISDDSDFFMTNCDFVRLSTVTFSSIPKKKYLPCLRFNVEEFCEITGVNKDHLPLLGTLIGNDYANKEQLKDFYIRISIEMNCYRKKMCMSRDFIIKLVIKWMAKRSDLTFKEVLFDVVGKRRWNLRHMIRRSLEGYTLPKSNLLDCIPYKVLSKESLKESKESPEAPSRTIEYVFNTSSSEGVERSSKLGTTLVMQNGEAPPPWFVKAYRENRIPHEAADILTQGYFFSPPQIECSSKVSSYLVVEPLVRLVFTFLRKGCESTCDQLPDEMASLSIGGKCNGDSEKDKSEAKPTLDSSGGNSSCSLENSNGPDPLSSATKPTSDSNGGDSSCSLENSNEPDSVSSTAKPTSDSNGGNASNGPDSMNSAANSEVDSTKSNKKDIKILSWYIRKGDHLYCKPLNLLKKEVAKKLPTLNEVGFMSCSERKSAFYKMMQMEHISEDDSYPADVELIVNVIVYWFKNTKMDLSDAHALTVLVSFLLFNFIDNKIGRLRTWKEFETVDLCKEKIEDMLKDPSYTNSALTEKDLVTKATHEEYLAASSALFRYHHIDQTMNSKKFKRIVVHTFSEYQACVYFLQLLNSLLCSPFPFLSIEFLWAGTFGYNFFIELSGSRDRLGVVRNILGKGTCLERLFSLIYNKLDSILHFSKTPVNKTDRFNSKKFADVSDRNEERVRIKRQDERKKQKMKEKSQKKKKVKDASQRDYDLGDNRFTALVSDSDEE